MNNRERIDEIKKRMESFDKCGCNLCVVRIDTLKDVLNLYKREADKE